MNTIEVINFFHFKSAKPFQQSDFNSSNMPNFARFYNSENSQPTYGLPVPDSANDFQTAYAGGSVWF